MTVNVSDLMNTKPIDSKSSVSPKKDKHKETVTGKISA